MPCYHPIAAWQSPFVKGNGKSKLLFSHRAGYTSIALPCGQCIGCRLERSRQWAIRCVLESTLHDDNHFITLTYDDANLPTGGTLVHKDIQLFIKTLRKKQKLRYFMAGEYGDQTSRPHYHMLLFGYKIKDLKAHGISGIQKNIIYTSEFLEKIWGKGHVIIGALTYESAAYVARYCIKKINGPAADAHYNGKKSEYAQMSRRPGIGSAWFEEFANDAITCDKIITRDLTSKLGKYYDRVIDKVDPSLLRRLKDERLKNLTEKDIDMRRLKTKEEYQRLKAEKLKRGYEKWKQNYS